MPLRLALLLLFADSGCIAWKRVSLREVPPITAARPVRVRAAKDLAIENGSSTLFYTSKNNSKTKEFETLDFVMLGDGTRVEDPRDLLPAVPPDSPTARFIIDYDDDIASAIRTKILLGSLSVAALVTSAICLGLGASSGYGVDRVTLLTVGAIGAGFGGVFAAIGLGTSSTPASDNRTSAFFTYNKALLRRLALDEDAPPPADRIRELPTTRLMPDDDVLQLALARKGSVTPDEH